MQRFKFVGSLARVVVFALVGAGLAPAQVTLDPAWPENPKTVGDFPYSGAYSVQQTADGGYVVAGFISPEDVGGGYDVYLINLDTEGNLDSAWDPNPKTFGGAHTEWANSIQQTTDGGYIVAGWTDSFGAGEHDVYLIKLDAAGNLDSVWDPNPKTFGGEDADEGSSVQQTTDGGYIVAGSTLSFGAGKEDLYLIKLDAKGNLDTSWDPNPKTFGGAEYDVGRCVQQTQDGGYVVGGSTVSGGTGKSDVYLIKLDAAGNLDSAWDPNPKSFGGARTEWANSVQQTTDGGYIVAGGTYSFSADQYDVYLIKLDAQGTLDPTWDPNPKTFDGEFSVV